MKHLLIVALCVAAFACAKGANGPACAANQANRCSCGGTTEGFQVCLPSGQAFGACDCTSVCANDPNCVPVPSVLGMDMDQTGAAVTGAGLKLPDPATLDGGFTVLLQVNDPPVEVLAQDPVAGTRVKPGSQVNLTVTLPPDQESLGLPNAHFLVGALNQDTDISAEAYYDAVDPGPFPKRATLQDWKDANGFGSGVAADLEAQATYVSHADLGFGRRMHVRKQGKRVAFYVDNYLMPDDAVKGSNFFATVTMEWSPGPNGTDSDPFFTQFYVYDKKGDRIIDPKLDDHGTKNNPGVCLACHGGTTDRNYQVNGGNLGAKFIPFDLDNLSYSTLPGASRAEQEEAFKFLNEAVYATWDPHDPAYATETPPTPPVVQMIDNWYGGAGHPSPTFISGTLLSAWDVATGHDLFLQVFGRNCITCHAQREPSRNFSTFAKFDGEKSLVNTRVFVEGAMPLSEKGNRNFWLSYPNEAKILANYLGVQLKAPGTPVAHITVSHAASLLTSGSVVTLSGQTSQFASKFTWSQTAGPAVQLTPAAPDNSLMTFVMPATLSTLTFQLVASMGGRDSAPDTKDVLLPRAPSAPVNVVATPGLGNAALTWTLPSDGGDTIQHSTITAQPGAIVTQVIGPATQAVVSGLTPGTAYTFTVVATNEIDNSPASANSNPVVPFTTPGAVTNINAARGDRQVILSWTPGNNGFATIVAYQITAAPAIGTVRVNAAGVGPQTTTITGLTNGTSYTFQIIADNGALGPPAASPSVTPDVAPLAPASVSTDRGNASATVSWTPPQPNGGTPISGYQLSVSPSAPGLPSVLPCQPQPTGCPLTTIVNNLTNNTEYIFTVQAQNGAGAGLGTAGPPVTPVANLNAPSEPVNVTATFANASLTASLSWSPPTILGGGGAVTSYQITATPALSATVVVGPATTSTNVVVPTGGLNYVFHVVAVNSAGAGPNGDSNAALIQGPPQAPTLNTVNGVAPGTVGGIGTLNAFWSAPANNGGSAITNYTASFNTTNVNAGTGLSVSSGALPSRCITYSVQVTATNQWGTSAASNPISRINAVVPGAPGTPTFTSSPATINLFWSGSPESGCTVSYTVNSSPAGVGFNAGTSTSGSTTAATCAYSGGVAHCGQSWTFNVTPSSGAGTGTTSGSTSSIRPLSSYSLDGVNTIFSNLGCTGCHVSPGNPLNLSGSAATSLASMRANANPVIVLPPSNVQNAWILACPEARAPCTIPTMLSVVRMSSGSTEASVLAFWLTDGGHD
jgi:hypothetical protein